MARAAVNMIGNAVATVVVSRWEKELSAETCGKILPKVETRFGRQSHF